MQDICGSHNLLVPGKYNNIITLVIFKLIPMLDIWAYPVNVPRGEYHKTPRRFVSIGLCLMIIKDKGNPCPKVLEIHCDLSWRKRHIPGMVIKPKLNFHYFQIHHSNLPDHPDNRLKIWLAKYHGWRYDTTRCSTPQFGKDPVLSA